jgi:hypothetical protein
MMVALDATETTLVVTDRNGKRLKSVSWTWRYQDRAVAGPQPAAFSATDRAVGDHPPNERFRRNSDRIVGNADDDILVAGTTAFDANELALRPDHGRMVPHRRQLCHAR